MAILTAAKLKDIILAMAKRIEQEKDFLTELDNAIGDGDHGINLARGFKAVEGKLAGVEAQDCGEILKTTGMQLVSTVGGASGPLYGTAFMKAGVALKGKGELEAADLLTGLEAAIGGIKMRGKATEGEKTMLDALCPAFNALKTGLDSGQDIKAALVEAVHAAEKGVEYTKTIIATKGRASYLGERSLGHQDPGATSSLYLLQVLQQEI
ncbi:MAG: dihydroxyacetone kinase subunit L [Selenomonadaceae bacterium]|nr:dihydroxyacetone kinase subunit L [Selenomonadaceae bacterium]